MYKELEGQVETLANNWRTRDSADATLKGVAIFFVCIAGTIFRVKRAFRHPRCKYPGIKTFKVAFVMGIIARDSFGMGANVRILSHLKKQSLVI